jgi:hypothetical protein
MRPVMRRGVWAPIWCDRAPGTGADQWRYVGATVHHIVLPPIKLHRPNEPGYVCGLQALSERITIAILYNYSI